MIEFKNVGFTYPRKRVFEDVSFELRKGGVYGLLGENGTGKSTILNLIVGTLKPSCGAVSIDGHTSFDSNTKMLQSLYMVPEEFDLPDITLNDFVKIYSVYYPNFSKEKVKEYAKRFRIDADFKLKKMSMGQRKKSLIAFAFATCCDIILLDEPTNGLDIPSKSVFRSIVAEVYSPDRLVIISTHQVRDVENLLDHIIIIDNKEVLINASIGEISEKLFFGTVENVTNPLYTEGIQAVSRNISNMESGVNIEILFNALMANKELIQSYFVKK